MEGCIFNIQKFSLHDGPGIRSVVFFKGCPLRCKWCANPESQSFAIQVIWDKSKCTKCLSCIKKNSHVHLEDDKIVATYDPDENYQTLCMHQALQVEGKMVSVDAVVDEVMKDVAFYEESGGGVTLSGGEVLAQPQFAYELGVALKRKNIHIAMETTGFARCETFQKCIENVDLLLFDMKNYDTIKHEQACGVRNEQIIANMQYAIKQGKEVIARIPIIPTYNDTLEDALAFAQLLQSIGVQKVNLLAFHQFGLRKYELLDMEYACKHLPQLHAEDLEAFKKVMEEQGLECYI